MTSTKPDMIQSLDTPRMMGSPGFDSPRDGEEEPSFLSMRRKCLSVVRRGGPPSTVLPNGELAGRFAFIYVFEHHRKRRPKDGTEAGEDGDGDGDGDDGDGAEDDDELGEEPLAMAKLEKKKDGKKKAGTESKKGNTKRRRGDEEELASTPNKKIKTSSGEIGLTADTATTTITPKPMEGKAKAKGTRGKVPKGPSKTTTKKKGNGKDPAVQPEISQALA